MGLTLEQLTKGSKAIDIDLGGGDTLSMTYNPKYYTAEFEAQLQGENIEKLPVAHMASMLSKIALSWKLNAPCTYETMLKIPAPELSKILTVIMEDSRPKEPTAETSDAG